MKQSGFRITTALITIVVAASAGPLAAQSRVDTDSALIRLIAGERAYAQLAIDSTTQFAFDRYFAPNGVVFRPRAIPASAYFRQRPMSPAIVRLWEPVVADISRAGDLGYTTGPWIASRRDNTRANPSFGEYLTIWRKQEDGAWKVEVDAAVGHGPDTQGPGRLSAPPRTEWRATGPVTIAPWRASLRAADSALAAAAKEKGIAQAFEQAGAPHLLLLRPGHFPLTGDSIASTLAGIERYTSAVADAQVAKSGDLGYTRGSYALLTGTRSAPVVERGDYIRVWRRARDGRWQLVLELSSPDSR